LPNSQWCYRPRAGIEYTLTEIPPCQANGFVTFGSFNHAPKLSPSTRRIWGEILARTPGSRLILVGVPEGSARDGVLRHIASVGIDAARISVMGRLSIDEYFRCFNAVDLALDTTPYSGGTTTLDALWMGVPVLTVPGCRPVSRSTAGILSAAGLNGWIAATPEDYVERAVAFASSGEAATQSRIAVRNALQASPLMDEGGFALAMEDAYRRMWRAWCDGVVADGGTRSGA
jgi:predicted O-linked N-acetylglucosamine transferase (SPINDLY family)